jgi:hypothetical protein
MGRIQFTKEMDGETMQSIRSAGHVCEVLNQPFSLSKGWQMFKAAQKAEDLLRQVKDEQTAKMQKKRQGVVWKEFSDVFNR